MKYLFLLPILFATNANAKVFHLNDFLEQVKNNNQAVQASRLTSAGAMRRSKDGELYLAPVLGVESVLSTDKRQTVTPAFQGTETKYDSYSVYVSKLTDFGMRAKLSYNISYTQIYNAPLIPSPNFYMANPGLEVSQAFWRNSFGTETRAQQQLLEASNLASSFGESFKYKMQLTEARNTYWRLVMARQIVAVQKDMLARAEKMFAWAERRVNLQLGDQSDQLQAAANLNLRKLELKTAQEEERSAALAFNSAIGLSSENVSYELESTKQDEINALRVPARKDLRDDVKAAREQQKIAIANAELNKEKTKPNLEIYSSMSLNGRDATTQNSTKESFQTTNPYFAIGLRFNTPLYFGLMLDTYRGAESERYGAELGYERKLFDQEQDWRELVIKFNDAKARLELTKTIEAIQKEKMLHEQTRLQKGRTTTYQALLFEQDYAQAQVLRIRTQMEILVLHGQLQLFGDEV